MRKTKNRLLSILLAAAIITTCFGSSLAAGLRDISGLYCELAVAGLEEAGVVGGYADGTYGPERLLTRAEAAHMLAKAFRLQWTGEDLGIADMNGHWAEAVVNACLENGLFDTENGLFGPSAPVGYVELCFYIVEALTMGEAEIDAEKAAFYAEVLGLSAGVQSKEGDITRGDAAVLLYSAITRAFVTLEGDAFTSLDDGVTFLGLLNADKTLESSEVLRYFALAGYYQSGYINAVKLDESPAAYMWDSGYNGFIPAEASEDNIIYNFVAVCDAAGGGVGDTLFIVNRGDSEKFWDADMDYVDPRGAEDPAYASAYNNEYNIPFGERLIGFADEDGFFSWSGAAMDYHNIVGSGDLDASTYYPTYDWYGSTSNDTLTMLTGFRTTQQSNGWACGLSSALMAMDWFNLRGDLNELDLAALRDTNARFGEQRWGTGTDVQMLIDVFASINRMEGKEVWKWESTYDFVDEDGKVADEYLSSEWIQKMLSEGRPVLVGWNSFGGHWQVIIGYDNMGTENTADDVLILADPYDTTDHRNDGYNIQSFERLYYDYTQNFDRKFSRDEGYGMTVIFAPYPADYDKDEYAPVKGSGLASKKGQWKNGKNTGDDMLIPYADTAKDLAASGYAYSKDSAGENGLAGPASSDYYKMFEYSPSPYYPVMDFFGGQGLSESLTLLKGFKTSQQASEWTCGPSSARMVLNWFDALGEHTEFSLAHARENDKEGATTLDGMVQIFESLNEAGGNWGWLTTDDMDDELSIAGYCLEDGAEYEGLIPYCLENGIPILIGWDEWGGHWQVIIGYDDMGTEETQDDVLILADPYDTTDHNQDGYVIESFERLVYGWGAKFDERGEYVFMIAAPAGALAAAGLMAE